ncbi:response regulator transcription factor [Cetobacterium sp. SF1]|uniref:response regulator transcription factor n=1 Tax=unclassified Cetobacterium TaxID=2630983 RepID=UPI003CEED27B
MMRKKILIIEDEKDLCNIIEDSLIEEGFLVKKLYDGSEYLDLFYDWKPELILLDINLPGKSGWKICEEIREISNIPIIIMTARDGEIDELKGLNLGADDYITKPFSLKILIARIKKILKMELNSVYKYEKLMFDLKNNQLFIDGNNIEISKKEGQVLEYLIRNKNLILTRELLINEIWGFDIYVEERTVDTLIKRVRKKMEDYNFLVKTIRGVGYTFNEN